MSRTLFLGDSHASGYYRDDTGKIQIWQDNSYAEAYSKIHDKDVIVYAIPGGCNKKYPIWLKSMLNRYDDIDEVFVQSTYWNRWLMAASRDLGYGDGTPTDMFIDDDIEDTGKVKHYSDIRVTENFIELVEQVRPELYEEFKGFTYNEKETTADWEPFHKKYPYTKLWYESQTHLQYRDYCGDLYIIDNLCRSNNIKWYLWNINDRVYMPENINLFGDLSCKRAATSARSFIKSKYGLDIDKRTIDGEHYAKDIHRIIAKEYIEELKNG